MLVLTPTSAGDVQSNIEYMKQMKCLLIISILMVASMTQANAQADTTVGLVFRDGMTWQQVIEAASRENKYIFVDCYASWCGPCKLMDKEVYPSGSVGQFMNDRFISIKLQMDSTTHDMNSVQTWYSTAHDFQEQFSIHAYPSFLFFSTDGALVHKDVGAKDAVGFLRIAQTALEPQKQYYTLLRQYNQGNLPDSLLSILATAARSLGQDSLFMMIAKVYMHHLADSSLTHMAWRKENVNVLQTYSNIINPTDDIFRMYYRDREKINEIMQEPGYADGLINDVIYVDKIKPLINTATDRHGEPQWQKIERDIKRNYTKKYADYNILTGRVKYYEASHQWNKYATYFVKRYTFLRVDDTANVHVSPYALNNGAYNIFKYSVKKPELREALSWINRAIEMVSPKTDANFLDTKANLLYKLGQKNEGLVLEQESASLAPRDKEIQASLAKMKSALPTWTSN
jgi:thioredoxin-related protein